MSVTMSATNCCNPANYARERPVTAGRLRYEKLSESNRNLSVFMHLAIPIGYFLMLGPFAFIAPLVLWKVFRNNSPFLEDQGREATNASLSLLLYHLLGPLVIIPLIIFVVSSIRGAVATSKSEYYRYPITIRFLSDPARPEPPIAHEAPNEYV